MNAVLIAKKLSTIENRLTDIERRLAQLEAKKDLNPQKPL